MLDHLWQKINAACHSCHSWQELIESTITAMTTIAFLLTVLTVLAALSLLVSYARHDHFGGVRNRTGRRDELGRSQPARLAL